MQFSYPYVLFLDGSQLIGQCPDLPGAISFGRTEEELAKAMEDALLTVLHALSEEMKPFPSPSEIKPGQKLCSLGFMDSAKLLLIHELKVRGIKKEELAKQLCVSKRQVYRLVSFRERGSIDLLERAFALLNLNLFPQINPEREEVLSEDFNRKKEKSIFFVNQHLLGELVFQSNATITANIDWNHGHIQPSFVA